MNPTCVLYLNAFSMLFTHRFVHSPDRNLYTTVLHEVIALDQSESARAKQHSLHERWAELELSSTDSGLLSDTGVICGYLASYV